MYAEFENLPYVGLLAVTVGCGDNAHEILEDSVTPISQALKSKSESSKMVSVCHLGLVFSCLQKIKTFCCHLCLFILEDSCLFLILIVICDSSYWSVWL